MADGPRTEQKLQGTERHLSDGKFTYNTKKVYHLWTSYMYVLKLEEL